MVDYSRITATLWRNVEDDMRRTYGDPNVMARFIPHDKMDDYQQARRQTIRTNLRYMLDSLANCVESNLDEFECGQLPSCLRGKTGRD